MLYLPPNRFEAFTCLSTTFTKDAADTERRRILALLLRQEDSIQNSFKLWLKTTTSEDLLREARVLLARGRIAEAINLTTQHTVILGDAIAKSVTTSRTAEAKALLRAVRNEPALRVGIRTMAADMMDAGVAISFKPGDQAASNIARKQAGDFVREFNRRQKQATRQAVSEALNTGQGPVATAKAFKGSIGLTKRQDKAVDNYRKLLQRGSAEALERDLRDRRFDARVQAALSGRRPLSSVEIDNMVNRYRQIALQARAETISRTEGLRAVEQARDVTLAETIDRLGISEDRITMIWNTTIDGRERHTHHDMDQQERAYGAMFDSPSGAQLAYPGDPDAPAEEVINCRCIRTHRFGPPR